VCGAVVKRSFHDLKSRKKSNLLETSNPSFQVRECVKPKFDTNETLFQKKLRNNEFVKRKKLEGKAK